MLYFSKFPIDFCFVFLLSFCFCYRDFQLRPFYIPPDQDSFVCSPPQSSGMTKCSEIPKLRKGDKTCELDFYTVREQLIKYPNKPINGCINWNQYYKSCNVSDKNPYSGSISFDNIGLAWVAIFQVREKRERRLHPRIFFFLLRVCVDY